MLDILHALVQTVHHLHCNNIMHNDLHAHNILLHFSETFEEVFLGLCDWEMMITTNIKSHYPPFKDDTIATMQWH